MLLVLQLTYLSIYPATVKLYLAGGAFLCTAVVPGLLVLLMIRLSPAKDLELSNRHERAIPYLIFITSHIICFFYLYRMHVPFWLLSLFIGACVALLVALCINFYWKISVHAIGTGGLLGALMGISRIQMINPFGMFIVVFVAAGLVCTARVLLKKHTLMQVYAGFGLGFICTFGASVVSYFYLFI
jgi:membrane-associated phospholipid phosphatase